MNNNSCITVNVIIDNKMVTRKIDLSKLNLSKLLELREQFMGNFDYFVTKIDAILNDLHLPDNACSSLNKTYKRSRIRSKQRKNSLSNKYYRR